MNKKVTFIIVNFNLEKYVISCISSIYKYTSDPDFDIMVVDNGSASGEIEKVNNIYPNVQLYLLKENMGFGYANNYAMRNSDSDYFVILNPDTQLIENSLSKLIGFLDANPEYGAIGTLIGAHNDSLEVSFDRFHNLRTIIEGVTGLWIKELRRLPQKIDKYRNEEIIEVDWVTGAFMVVPRTVFEKTRGFDENFFLYDEDVDWCLRIRKAGYKIGCYIKTKVLHTPGTSTKRDYASLIYQRNKSKIIYMRKHFAFFEIVLAHLVFILSITIRLPLLYLLPKVKYRRERFIGYLRSLKLFLFPWMIKISY